MLSENMKLIYKQRSIRRNFEIHERKLVFFRDLSDGHDYLIHNRTHIIIFEPSDEDALLQRLNEKWKDSYELSTYDFSKSNENGNFIIREELEEFYDNTKLIIDESAVRPFKRSSTKILSNIKKISPLFVYYKKNIWLAITPKLIDK